MALPGPVKQGIELGDRCKPDFAVLDIRLADGGLGTDIAARLHSRHGVGILYASGNSSHMGLTKDDGEALLHKPYRAGDVVRALKIVEQIVRTGEAPQPFPRGFSVLIDAAPKSGTLSDSADHQDDGIRPDSGDSRRSLRTNTLHGATLCPKPSATAPQPRLCRPSSTSILTFFPISGRRVDIDVIDRDEVGKSDRH